LTHNKDGTLYTGRHMDEVAYIWTDMGWTIQAMELSGLLHAAFMAMAVLAAGIGVVVWRAWLGKQYNKMELPKYRD